MAYQIPPWIPGAQDVAGQFSRGAQLGLEQLRMERENVLRQEEFAQRQAYQQQEMALRQQELQQQEQLNQIKIQQAARTYQAQQNFQRWLQEHPDEDPAVGMMKFFPGTDETMTGYGQLARQAWLARQRLQPPTFGTYTTPGGRELAYATYP